MKLWIRQRINTLFASIRLRVLLIALLPLLICASALTAVTVYLRTQDSEANLQAFAETTIANLASSAEFGLYSGNLGLLRRATEIPLQNEYIAGVMFYDAEGKLLLSNGTAPVPDNLLQNAAAQAGDGMLRYYLQPIVVFDDDLMDQDGSDAQTKRIGWVAIAITRAPLAQLHNQILLTSLLAFSLIFSLSLLLANRIGRSISRPLYKISDAVAEMETGKLQKRIPVIGTRETRLLASTLNRLAARVEITNQQLQERVDLATEKLQQALRDLELRNSDLEDIRADLEAALTAKDAFLARMSHELRTPLTSVIGFNRLLDSSTLSPQQRQYTRNIDQASVLLLSTIEDILDFSKLESGAMTFELIDFDLLQCIEDLVALQACNVYDKDLELVLLFDSDVPAQVQGDPVRLKQILNNLLSNALKFTERGEIIVRVSVMHRFDGRVILQFMVKDSGIGIARENLRHLFQPFHQADNTISRRFGGTGLGLSICQQLIEQMGGEIAIDSTPGVGTEVSFSLEFPFLAGSAELASVFVSALPVLIIDSMPWSRRALRNYLSPQHTQIFAVASLEAATTLLESRADFAMLVLSLRNSELNETAASTVLQTLREHYAGPILLLVGSVDFESDVLRTIQQQFSPLYLLAKPVKRLQLQQAIESVYALDERSDYLPQAGDNPTTTALAGLSILVVEDNPFNRQLLQSLLDLHGADCSAASDGAAALQHLTSHAVDIVLIDMHMPVMNGIETTQQICARPKPPLVIGLTADLDSRNIEQMRQAGAVAVLGKPIDETLLLATLCEQAGRHAPAAADTSHLHGNSLLADSARPALRRELQQLCTALDSALQAGNAALSSDILHQLQGLAGLFGLQEIHHTVRELAALVSRTDRDAQNLHNATATLLQTLLDQLQQSQIDNADTPAETAQQADS